MATVAPVVHAFQDMRVDLPPVRLVRQRFAVPAAIDVVAEVRSELVRLGGRLHLSPGAKIAVAVGSRGIDNLVPIVRAVIGELRVAGCRPFVVPAMGSHGGATAEGQISILASLGITEATIDAPIHATMETVAMGEVDGIPLHMDRNAAEADGIVLINRVKPHPDFPGPMGSGLLKMMCIGLGKQEGASHYHRLGVVRGLGDVLHVAGAALVRQAPVKFGVAIVENQQHRVCKLRFLLADELEEEELRLQGEARALLPGLPLDDIDVLIVDEMGKEISGSGLDPNVIGRSAGSAKRTKPRIGRIFVRELTELSGGNACGLAFIDLATARLIESVDLDVTAMNAVTSCMPEDVHLPLTLPNDREAIAVALATIRPFTQEDLRIVHIRNTLAVERLVVSEGCLPELEGRDDVQVGGRRMSFGFNSMGNLISPLEDEAAWQLGLEVG